MYSFSPFWFVSWPFLEKQKTICIMSFPHELKRQRWGNARSLWYNRLVIMIVSGASHIPSNRRIKNDKRETVNKQGYPIYLALSRNHQLKGAFPINAKFIRIDFEINALVFPRQRGMNVVAALWCCRQNLENMHRSYIFVKLCMFWKYFSQFMPAWSVQFNIELQIPASCTRF